MQDLDHDLESLSAAELMAEVRKLRVAIRRHRDASGHELCWYHPELWSLLPEEGAQTPTVPAWPEFLKGCIKFRTMLDQQMPDAPRTVEKFEENHQNNNLPHP